MTAKRYEKQGYREELIIPKDQAQLKCHLKIRITPTGLEISKMVNGSRQLNADSTSIYTS